MKKILEMFGEPILNGGQETFAIGLLEVIDKNKFSCDFFTPYEVNNRYYEEIIRKNGGEIYSLGSDFKKKRYIYIFIQIYKFFKTNKYDILHVNSGSTLFLAMVCLLSKIAGVKKTIVHSHCSGAKENIKHYIIKKISSPIFTLFADEICACSYEAAKWKYPKRLIKERAVIVKNGIDTSVYRYRPYEREKLRNALGISKDEYVIGHVGRFTYEKNQKFLIELVNEYVKYNDRIKLILVGDGDDFCKIKRMIRNYHLEAYVKMVGRTNEVDKYLQIFDVFVFPSLYEGLGTVAIEAQATGLPVIASSNVPETIKILEKVCFISLEAGKEMWIEKLEEYKKYIRERTSCDQAVINAGYSINYMGKQMESLFEKSL